MEHIRGVRTGAAAVAVALALAAVAASAVTARAEVNPWAKGSQWLTVRAGYSKAATEESGNGLLGYGLGYQRMLNKRWTGGLFVHHEAVSRFGAATEITVPLTVELARHYDWKTALRPYLGIGGGAYYHKVYRTGDDADDLRSGVYVTTGGNAVIAERQMVGLDVRASVVRGGQGINPVFGPQEGSNIHWSIKLGWMLVY